MRVIVKARHMNLTPALREHAEDKLGRALMRIFDRPDVTIEIELSQIGNVRNGAKHECRVIVSMPKANPINIREIDDNMYKAIDFAHDRLLHQVNQARGRRKNTSNARKMAKKQRNQVAREELTVAQEPWQREVEEFEQTQMRA